MAEPRIIISGRRAELKGEVKSASREVRLAALKGLEALSATTRVAIVYSLLYDSDTRVRAVARKELLTLPVETLKDYIDTDGHPKVLDFLVRNLPKNSPVLPVIASAPNLAHRTRQFVKAAGIQVDAPAPTAAPPAPNEAMDVELEWKPPSEDFDLPDGVEFNMPVDGEEEEIAHPPKKSAMEKDLGDTSPALPPKPAPAPKIDPFQPLPPDKPDVAPPPLKLKPEPVPEPDETQFAAPPAPKAVKPVKPRPPVDQNKTVPVYVEPPPVRFQSDDDEPEFVESKPPPPQKEFAPEPDLPPEPAPEPGPARAAAPPPRPTDGVLFPVLEKPVARAKAPAMPMMQGKPEKVAKGHSSFVIGLMLGVIVGGIILLGMLMLNKFAPGWHTKIFSSGSARQQAPAPVPAHPQPGGSPVTPPTRTPTPTPDIPPTANVSVDIYLGVYKSQGSMNQAQKKAAALGLETAYTRKDDDQTIWSIAVGASGTREDADRKASGIRSLGIPASVSGGTGGRWTIFCGSLNDEDAAKKRAIALRASGYGASISQSKRKQTTFTMRALNVPGESKDDIMQKLKDAGFKPRVL